MLLVIKLALPFGNLEISVENCVVFIVPERIGRFCNVERTLGIDLLHANFEGGVEMQFSLCLFLGTGGKDVLHKEKN